MPLPNAIPTLNVDDAISDAWVDAVKADIEYLYGTGSGTRTTSPMSGGPPASPGDGDIWIATGVDAAGTRWAFQYNAGSSSVAKWEFIGGPPKVVGGSAGWGASTSTVYTDFSPALSFTLPRNGDYFFRWGAMVFADTIGTNMFLGLHVGSTAQLENLVSAPGNNYRTNSVESLAQTGRTFGDVMSVRGKVSANTGTFQNGWFDILPIRIQ